MRATIVAEVLGVALLLAGGCDGGATQLGDADAADGADDGSRDVPVEAHDDSDVHLDCTAPLGTGSLAGTVQGEALSAAHAGAAEFSVMGLHGYMIAFTSDTGTCADGAALMSGAPLAVQLCNVTPGDHAVGEDCVPDGGGMSISASVKLQRVGGDVSADAGTITILEFDAACGGRVRGSFTSDFAGEVATGTFDTVSCGSVAL